MVLFILVVVQALLKAIALVHSIEVAEEIEEEDRGDLCFKERETLHNQALKMIAQYKEIPEE